MRLGEPPESNQSAVFWLSPVTGSCITSTLLSPQHRLLTGFTVTSVNIQRPGKKAVLCPVPSARDPLGPFPWKGPLCLGKLDSIEQSFVPWQVVTLRVLSTDSLFLELSLVETLFLTSWPKCVQQDKPFFWDMWLGHWELRWLIPDLVMYLCVFSLLGSSSHLEPWTVFMFLLPNSTQWLMLRGLYMGAVCVCVAWMWSGMEGSPDALTWQMCVVAITVIHHMFSRWTLGNMCVCDSDHSQHRSSVRGVRPQALCVLSGDPVNKDR